jgi:dolichol-phosphate mannosyltransferase
MKICVIIPTLNEENNILNIFNKLKKTKIRFDLLFVDDNSRDKSRKIIKDLKNKFSYIKYIFRNNKSGIGSAHKEGISFCYKKKYDLIITMDADGSHDPKYIKPMIKALSHSDYVITTRFKKPNSLIGWPLSRKLITYSRHLFVKIFLGMNYDASGAFRCFKRNKIKLNDILSAKNNDYAFFWEVTYNLNKMGYKIYEVPVELIWRKLGKSKMKIRHIFYSFFYLFKIFLSNL